MTEIKETGGDVAVMLIGIVLLLVAFGGIACNKNSMIC